MKHKDVRDMAEAIAKTILTIRSEEGEQVVCNRIALMSGEWPDNEKNEGGMCRSALEQVIFSSIVNTLYGKGQLE